MLLPTPFRKLTRGQYGRQDKKSTAPNKWYWQCGVYFLVVAIALLLKYHYSHAGSDDLIWILAPTAKLVGWFQGLKFVYEAGSGFFNGKMGVMIAPACAGINFLISVFCTTALWGLPRTNPARSQFYWLIICALSAYSLTLLVNALRISSAIYLYQADIYGTFITPARIHRLMGIAIYLLALCSICALMDTASNLFSSIPNSHTHSALRSYSSMAKISLRPIIGYLCIVLMIPLLNTVNRHSKQFTEHCEMVIISCIVVFTVLFLIQIGRRYRYAQRTSKPTKITCNLIRQPQRDN